MVKRVHLEILKQGVEEWNQWRKDKRHRPNLSKANLSGATLYDANLSKANLSGATLYDANPSKANLSGVNFSHANLTRIQALGADLAGATLTGACIEDWNINSQTNLDRIICDYVYLKQNYQERRPAIGNFAPGDFTRLFQKMRETVDLIFRDGIDWRSFAASFQELQAEQRVKIEGEEAQFKVREIKTNDDGSFVIRIDVPAQLDKAEIEESFRVKYENQLQLMEVRYRAELNTKDEQIALFRQHNADLKNIIDILASRPIQNIIDVNAHAGSQAMSETYQSKYDQRKAQIGGIVDTAQSGSHPEFQQHNYSERNLAEAAAEIQQLIDQLSQTYSSESPLAVAAKVETQIKNDPTLKEKAIKALANGSLEAVKACGPIGAFVVGAIEGMK